ncbi:Protein SCAF8 [Nymphon striatum]|nr:Protein SCAF8 [Nymphon striatum]
MTAVTKSALKAIKYYKHVVQGVEKFIQKCKSEYKVPGLYVIDSIVRQSRHQHGPENDVFAQRFARNFKSTLQHLFKCPEDQRPKIVRVLNLWQKNKVFTSDVIQPLLDMAHPNALEGQEEAIPGFDQGQREENANNESSGWSGWNERGNQAQQVSNNTKEQASQNLFQQSQVMDSEINFSNLNSQSMNNLHQLASQISGNKSQEPVKFNKKLLDFDYGDEDEEDDGPKEEDNANDLAIRICWLTPELLQQLEKMQQTIQQTQALKNELSVTENLHKEKLRQQEQEFQIQIQAQEQQQQMHDPVEMVQNNMIIDTSIAPPSYPNHLVPNYPPPFNHAAVPPPTMAGGALTGPFAPEIVKDPPDVIVLEGDGKDVDLRRRDEEEKRSPHSKYGKRRHRSRSPTSRDRERRSRRSRSGSRSGSRSRSNRYRRDRRSRSRSRDRERERERERERRKKGLPPIRKNYMNVCSTTLWLGHVPKTVPESEIHDVFGEFGTVATVNIIPPRGCAYVCMDRRQDAYRALQKLRNLKLQNSTIKMAWAPGKGMKGKQYKDYWEVDLGVSCIPYDKIPDDVDLDLLEEGGVFDEDTVPTRIKEKMEKSKTQKAGTNLRQMNTDDLLALAEAQAPRAVITKAIAQPQDSAMIAAVASTAGSTTLIDLPVMQPVVQPQFAGMPPMPIPGQPVMLPPQLPGFQPGVRFAPVLPPTSTNQLIPPSFTGTVVGGLPMGITTNAGMIRHPGLLPQPLMPPRSTPEITKESDSKSIESVNRKPKRTTSRFNSVTEASVTLNSNTDSPLNLQESIANIPPPGVVQGMPTPLMTTIGNFHPLVSQGPPETMSSEDQNSDMNVRPAVSSSVPLLAPPPMQDNSGVVHGEMRPPIRFPERPWMDRDMFPPRPPHSDFNGEDVFEPDYPPDQRMFMDRDRFHGPPPPDWHEPFDRYNDRPPFDRWNDDRRWEMDRGGREPWDGDYRQDFGPPRRDRPQRGRNERERNSRFAPLDSEVNDSHDNKSKESGEKNLRHENKSPEYDKTSRVDDSEQPAPSVAEQNSFEEKSDIILDTSISDEIPSKLDKSADVPADPPTPIDLPISVAPISVEPTDSIDKQETVNISDSLSSDMPKNPPEMSAANESSEQKSEN